jgi:hypothetical protein
MLRGNKAVLIKNKRRRDAVEILKKAAQRDLAPEPIFSKARNQRSIFSDSDIYQSVLSPLSRISSSHNSTKPL